MTDIDTSPEAVNWVALTIETAARLVALQSPTSAAAIDEAAALLRQLAKEKAEARNAALRQAAEKVMEFDRKPAKELWPLPIANAILALITSKPDEPTSETAGSGTSSA